MSDFLARLERQADALEVEIAGTAAAADAAELGFNARQLGARAGLLGVLEWQAEAALCEGRSDLRTLDALSEQLQSRSAQRAHTDSVLAASPRCASRSTPTSARAYTRPGFASTSPRFTTSTSSKADSRAVGGETASRRTANSAAARQPEDLERGATCGSTQSHAAKVVKQQMCTETKAACPGKSEGPCEAGGPSGPAALTEAASICTSVSHPSDGPAAAGKPRGASSKPSRGTSKKPSKPAPQRSKWAASASSQGSRSTKVPTTQTGRLTQRVTSGGAEAVRVQEARACARRSALVGASEQVRVSAERQRQQHMDKRLARAEAALHKLLAQHPHSQESAGTQPHEDSSPTPTSTVCAKVTGQQASTPTASKTTPSLGTSTAAPHAASPRSGASKATTAGACASDADDRHNVPSRRQEIAVLVSAEANLLDAMLGITP